jgi:hypothetical protein
MHGLLDETASVSKPRVRKRRKIQIIAVKVCIGSLVVFKLDKQTSHPGYPSLTLNELPTRFVLREGACIDPHRPIKGK